MKFTVMGDKDLGFKGSMAYEPGVDPALDRCPFCGSSDVEVAHTHTPHYWVQCNQCEGQAGSGNLKLRDQLKTVAATRRNHRLGFLAAIAQWNRRAGSESAPKVGTAGGTA